MIPEKTASQGLTSAAFSLDILATTSDDRKVIIENQLEPSDHRHLAQCLTYAAGVGASVIVWVLPRLQAEHRAALDWLNEHTDERTIPVVVRLATPFTSRRGCSDVERAVSNRVAWSANTSALDQMRRRPSLAGGGNPGRTRCSL